MYETYYGFSGKPFQLNPDPSFYFGSRQHKRAMSYLEYGLHQNEGFIVVTGEIGAGKTTIVRHLFSQLDLETVVAAHLVSTQLDADDILRVVAAAFGIPTKNSEKSDVLLLLEAFLVSVAKNGKRCLLIVDEAQNLSSRAVEELRMLSNFQLETHALLQSFLIGQPEFRETLQRPEMEQLRQRVIAACHIGPLSDVETRQYIEHRLACVGWNGTPEFDSAAHTAIFRASGGIPRRINALTDRLLWFGYLAEKKAFSGIDVEDVDTDMNSEARESHGGARNRLADDRSAESSSTADAFGSGTEMLPVEFKRSGESPNAFPSSENGTVGDHLMRLELGIRRLDESLRRIERSNLLSTNLSRRLLDLMKRHEAE